MREGWEYKKLGEVASSELGKTLNKSKDTGKLYPYICAVNVLWDMIDLTILKHAFFEKEEIDRYSVRKGDLLVCEGGDTGRSAIWEKEEPVLYQNALHRVRFTTEMEARFAMYCLWHLKNNGQIDQKYSKGVTIKHLVKSSLLSIELPVPPLSTQLSIVSELDKINELIRLKKEQLKDYDNLAQSIFYEMFGDPIENEKGWEVKKLSSITSKIGSGATPKGGNESYKTEGISLIRSLNVHNNEFLYKDLAHIDNEQAEALSNVEIKEYDVLLNITGASVARCCIVPDDVIPARVNQHVCIVRTIQEKALPIFINRVLTNENFQANLLRLARSKAATREALPKSIVDNIQVPLPPLSLQQLFAQRIELIEQQKAEIKSTITDLETLLASRMQYWFD
ncbi:MAG: restriction endonuclease subunit S [Bacteroidales bacterium]|nr:restriction endonuclease subunit S [Bacteroidales bacterium]